MNIEFSSNSGMARSRLLTYLRDIRAADKRFRVVDLGGAASPWTAEVADAFVDLHPSEHLPTITGDLHSPELWREIKSRNFDFCICSHTLEDLRDPIFVLSQIKETFRRGYIAVPNKHVEFGHIESAHYVGYGHHRWVFTLVPGELRLIAKWPFASYFSPRRAPFLRFKAGALARAFRRLRSRKPGMSAGGPLPWWRRDLSGPNNELAFIWNGAIEFRAINSDYAGESTTALAQLYREALREGL
jgi:hypothetical protein